jgi:peptidoglycan/LPS O-acetylase OafA/YrhL
VTAVAERPRERLTVRDAGARGSNSLNFIRLVLASAVIVSHTAAIGGFHASMPPWIGWVAEWAVNGFFALSGFLIARSRMTTPFGPYIWNRALRIFPAYWCALLAVALVLAPLSTLITDERYSPTSAANYLLNNSMLLANQWGIEGTLQSVPLPGAWNGSLWTLFYEFWAYLLAGALLSFAWVRRRPAIWTAGALVVVLVVMVFAGDAVEAAAGQTWTKAISLASFFLAGMLMHFLGDRLPLSTWIAVGSLVVLLVMLELGYSNSLGQLPFAYILLWFAGRVPVRIGSRNDISYGVYVYAFPVQQMVAVAGGAVLGPWGFALVSLALTVPLAWVSWTVVERPAMRYRMSRRAATSPVPGSAVEEPVLAAAAPDVTTDRA